MSELQETKEVIRPGDHIKCSVPKSVTTIAFDFDWHAAYAKDVLGVTNPYEVGAWVQAKFDQMKEAFCNLEPDDVLIHPLVIREFWFVGQCRTETEDGRIWEFQGVFDSQEKAIAACRSERYFVAPCLLNEELPDETFVDSQAFYPLLN